MHACLAERKHAKYWSLQPRKSFADEEKTKTTVSIEHRSLQHIHITAFDLIYIPKDSAMHLVEKVTKWIKSRKVRKFDKTENERG
jgi:hypothetical protein